MRESKTEGGQVPMLYYWKGRDIRELTREELLVVCAHLFEQHRTDRDELQRRLNAMDAKQYLMNGGSSARV